MAHPLTPFADDLRQAIEDVSTSARGTLRALRARYVRRAKASPTSVLGAPRPLARQALPSPLPALADIVLRLGGGAAPLLALARADHQLDDLVEGHAAGLFALNNAPAWIAQLKTFEKELEQLAAKARESLPRWSQLDPSPRSAPPAPELEMLPEILTPELAVARMGGSITEAGLRARIRKGEAGPWRRVGGKWQIATSAFLAWHRKSSEEAQAADKRKGEALEQLAQQLPRRGGPQAAGALNALLAGGKKPS